MKRKLTDVHLRQARPRGARYELRDGGGLALWVYPSGSKKWVFTYFLPGEGGKKAKVRWVFGEYPALSLTEARAQHEAARKLLKDGKDPKAEHERKVREEAARRAAEANETTVRELCHRYLELYAKPNKKSWAQDARQLRADVLPAWGNRKAREINRADVQALLDAIAGRGAPVAANRMRALLSRVFRWARSRGYVDTNPVEGIEAPAKERPKTRVLSEEEVRVFWNGLDHTALTDPVKRALRLILVTAQRPGEVVGMRYEELSEHAGRVLWTIPAARRKGNKAHVVPLPALALELIGPWKGRTGPVFVGPKGGPITPEALSYALRRNLGEPDNAPPAKHGKRQRIRIPVAHFTPHDLRRTAATLMSGAGVAGLVKPLVLGHSPQDVTRRHYDLHDYLDEKALALEAWARRLRAIVTGEKPGKVIPLRGRA